jgi:hypothetical protein
MKIHANDYERMRSHCALIMRRDTFPQVVAEYRAKGLSDKRLRWDVLHASKFPIVPLYSYLDDEHIDTALKMIFASVTGSVKQV